MLSSETKETKWSALEEIAIGRSPQGKLATGKPKAIQQPCTYQVPLSFLAVSGLTSAVRQRCHPVVYGDVEWPAAFLYNWQQVPQETKLHRKQQQ